MKIIAVDNQGRDTVADRLVAENIKSETEGFIMLEALRTKYARGSTWYELVPDVHKLWGGMEELV